MRVRKPATTQPKPPNSLSGGGTKALAAYVERIPAGDNGNFGLTDEEIIRPSRSMIIDWLKGRTRMLASHWSRIAADMLQDGETDADHFSAAE